MVFPTQNAYPWVHIHFSSSSVGYIVRSFLIELLPLAYFLWKKRKDREPIYLSPEQFENYFGDKTHHWWPATFGGSLFSDMRLAAEHWNYLFLVEKVSFQVIWQLLSFFQESIYLITSDKNNKRRNIQGFSVELNPVQGKHAGGLADGAVLNIMIER